MEYNVAAHPYLEWIFVQLAHSHPRALPEVPQQQLAASNTIGCQIEQVQSDGLSLVWHIVPRVVVVVEGVAAAAAATMTGCAAGSQLSVV
jgi:hypothetical protein